MRLPLGGRVFGSVPVCTAATRPTNSLAAYDQSLNTIIVREPSAASGWIEVDGGAVPVYVPGQLAAYNSLASGLTLTLF